MVWPVARPCLQHGRLTVSTPPDSNAARLDVDYPDQLDRATTFFGLILAIPILVILGLLTTTGNEIVVTEPANRSRPPVADARTLGHRSHPGRSASSRPAVNRYRPTVTPWRVTESLVVGGAVRGAYFGQLGYSPAHGRQAFP